MFTIHETLHSYHFLLLLLLSSIILLLLPFHLYMSPYDSKSPISYELPETDDEIFSMTIKKSSISLFVLTLVTDVGFLLQFRTHKVIYRRYAGLFFSMCVDITDNELAYLECIHLFVEILDHFFSNVCELDLVFNFHKVTSMSH